MTFSHALMRSSSPIPIYDSDEESVSYCSNVNCMERRASLRKSIQEAQDDCECDYRNCYVLELEIAALEDTVKMWEAKIQDAETEKERLKAILDVSFTSESNFLRERAATLGAIRAATRVSFFLSNV